MIISAIGRKENTMMTRRELINLLLDGDMDQVMWITVETEEGTVDAVPIVGIDNDVLIGK